MWCTEEVDGALVGAQRVRRDALVSSVVVGVDVDDAQTQRQSVISVIISLDAVLVGTDDATSVLLPVVDGVRIGGDAALEDRLAATSPPPK